MTSSFYKMCSDSLCHFLWQKYLHQTNRPHKYYFSGILILLIGLCFQGCSNNDRKLEILRQKVNLLEKKGDLPSAITTISELIQLSPADPLLHYDRAVFYDQSGNYKLAQEGYQQAIKLNSKLTQAWNNLGIIHLKQDNLNEALDNFSKTLEIDPKFILGYQNRGQLLFKQAKYKESLDDYEAALKLDPKNAYSLEARGLARMKLGLLLEAYEDLVIATYLEPTLQEASKHKKQLQEQLQLIVVPKPVQINP